MLDTVTGRYTNSTRLQYAFGAANVEKWLDMNDEGTTDAPSLEERLAVLMESAESLIDDYLRGSVVIEDTVPETITSIATDLTAVNAYESRGINDRDVNPVTGVPMHRLGFVYKRAMNLLDKIKSGQIRLALDDRITYPVFVDE